MDQYLLLLHETPTGYADLSPAQMQEMIARYAAWAQSMAEKGHLVSGHKLTDDGGVQLRRRGSETLATDGPYAEARDVIGGFFVIRAAGDAQARELAASCAHLQHGSNWIEVRKIDPV
jgi:hypothetical protein